MFQQKKICIIESIEFIFTDEECHAAIYVSKWYRGKLCDHFLEKLHSQRVVHFVDDEHRVWKIIPTPSMIQRTMSQKWFQQQSSSEIPVVKMKMKPKPEQYDDDNDDVSEVTDESYVSESEYNTDDSDIDSLFTEVG